MYVQEVENINNRFIIPSDTGSGLDGYKLIDGTLDGELVIPAGKVDKITSYGLAGISVTKIDLKDSGVKNISQGVFANDHNLTEIVLPDSLETIGSKGFWGCYSITDIDFNSSVTIDPYYTFAGCSELVKVPILTITTDDIMVNNYTDNTFGGCGKLKKVIITNAKVIGPMTFSGCTSLEYLYLGPTVTSINSGAFGGVPITCKVRCGFSEGAISGFPANGGWAGNPNDLDIEYDVPVPTEYPED